MSFPLPPLSVNVALLPFAIVAASMVVVTIFVLTQLLPRDRAPTLLSSMTIGLAALSGGSVLLLALLFALVSPDGSTAWTWVLLAFNFMMMGPAGLWFVSVVAFRDRAIDRGSWVWPVVLALVTVGSEVLMGVLFALGGGRTSLGLVGALAGGLTSVWFDWSMAAVMASLVLWLPLRGLVRGTLGALTAAAALAPWVTAVPEAGVAGMAVLMAVVLALLYRHLSGGRTVRLPDLRVLFWLAVAFAVMSAAQAAVVIAPTSPVAALVFGAAMAIVMGAEVAFVSHQALGLPEPSDSSPWPDTRGSTVALSGPLREH
jgi:hypothetical protein